MITTTLITTVTILIISMYIIKNKNHINKIEEFDRVVENLSNQVKDNNYDIKKILYLDENDYNIYYIKINSNINIKYNKDYNRLYFLGRKIKKK
jgi:phosphopantetheine adenylyltransferase